MTQHGYAPRMGCADGCVRGDRQQSRCRHIFQTWIEQSFAMQHREHCQVRGMLHQLPYGWLAAGVGSTSQQDLLRQTYQMCENACSIVNISESRQSTATTTLRRSLPRKQAGIVCQSFVDAAPPLAKHKLTSGDTSMHCHPSGLTSTAPPLSTAGLESDHIAQ